MISPYINTYLLTNVSVHPSQMNNNIRNHIKDNLIKKVTNKCFSSYGYVVQVHDISYGQDAKIIPEDPSASAIYNVKFLCTLCHPLNNSMIVGHIKGINQMVIQVSNGPLDILINTIRSINGTIFKFNNKLRVWTAQRESDKEDSTEDGGKKFIVLKPGTCVKVKILSKKIIDKSERILCLGYLDSVATEEETIQSMKDGFTSKDGFRSGSASIIENIDEYVSQNLTGEDEDGAEDETDGEDNS
jgi:DNA-directed RNA polymerase subunit E'/Rpb7